MHSGVGIEISSTPDQDFPIEFTKKNEFTKETRFVK